MPGLDPSSLTKQDLTNIPADEINPSTLKQAVVGEGNIGVVSALGDATFSSDGFYNNPSPVVLYNNYDLNNLSDNNIGIVVETYPYTETVLEDGNNFIDIYSSVSDFADPVINHASSETVLQGGSDRGETFDITLYTVTFADSEIIGLKDRFGWESAATPEVSYNNRITSLTLQTAKTFKNTAFVFKYQRADVFTRDNYSIMSPRPAPSYYSTGSASETQTMLGSTTVEPTTTTTTMGY